MSVAPKPDLVHEEPRAPELRVAPRQVRRTTLDFVSILLALAFVLAEFAWLSFLGYLAVRHIF